MVRNGEGPEEEDLDEARSADPQADARGTGTALPDEASEVGGNALAHSAAPSAERHMARVDLACRIYQARLDRAQFFRFPVRRSRVGRPAGHLRVRGRRPDAQRG